MLFADMDSATQLALVVGITGAVMALLAMGNTVLMFWLNAAKERRQDERAVAKENADIAREQRNLEALRHVKDATEQQTGVMQQIGQKQITIGTVAAMKVAEVAVTTALTTALTAKVAASASTESGVKIDRIGLVLDNTHHLVNGAMTDQLKKNAEVARRLADSPTHTQVDVVAAELAERLYREHVAIGRADGSRLTDDEMPTRTLEP